jgi:anaerobic magnesium-protoporphyrin IX monomethyl ester cyclase
VRKKHDIDVVLINPANQKRIYQDLGKSLTAIEPPVWAGLIANYLRKKGFSVIILDSCAENWSPKETAEQVNNLNPLLTTIVLYGQQPSASTQVMPSANSVAKAIKEMSEEHRIMYLGGHAAALPEQTLVEEPCDFVACGEGLVACSELIELLKTSSIDYSKVSDLCYFDKGKVVRNKATGLIKDLDSELPGIAWDLLPMEKYRAHNWHCFGGKDRTTYASLYTTLGCPFKCSFCCIQAPFKSGEKVAGYKEAVNSYRFWSPNHVIAQIDLLVKKYGVKNFKFADEMFVLNKKHVIEICDLIIERGYDINIWAYTRVDTVKDEMTDKMKAAGINWLGVGIEAANVKVRDEVQKGVGQEDIFSVVKRIQSAGINVGANYIFGLPEDNYKTMQETLDLAIDLHCEYANFYSAMAYPGSKLFKLAKESGARLPETWGGYSQHAIDSLPLDTNYIKAEEVLKFRDDAFRTYFHNENYLNHMAKTFGHEALSEIKEMTKYDLIRDNYPKETIEVAR